MTDGGLDKSSSGEPSEEETVVRYGSKQRYRALIHHGPFSINFFRDDELDIKVNSKGVMNVEHWRAKVAKVDKGESEKKDSKDGEDESTRSEETFGGNVHSKPRRPESVGMDINFMGYQHVYGKPVHVSSLSLKETRYHRP